MNKFVAMMMFVALAFSSQMVMAQPPPPVETAYAVTTTGAEFTLQTAALIDAAAKWQTQLIAAMATLPGPGETVFMNSATLMGPGFYSERQVYDEVEDVYYTLYKYTVQGGFKTIKYP